jgi:hypothetical protein
MTLKNAERRLKNEGATFGAIVNNGQSKAWTMPSGYHVQVTSQNGEVLCYHIYSPNHTNEPFSTCYSVGDAVATASPARKIAF